MADVRAITLSSSGGFSEATDSDLAQLGGVNLSEAASVPGGNPGAARGKLWVRNDAPNVLVFTDDTNVDTVLGAGGGGVDVSGTPANNQLAIWTDADTLEGDANITWDASTLALATSGATKLIDLTSTATGAQGVLVESHHNTSSPFANDVIYRHSFFGEDSGSNKTEYARMDVLSQVVTGGTEQGLVKFEVITSATLTELLRLDGSASPTQVVVNDGGGNVDFRVEGQSLAYLIHSDGSAATENIALLAASAPNWQSMDRGIFIGDTSTAPTGDPSSGGFLYVSSGALYWRGSGGNITKIASA